ncbi:homoserine kinase [Rhodospirillum rubrum]|uniref:homoserine kinase n=1 Tax=Rhodospirillum rubrum TaxID=1085 RepID=UPI0019034508|nr:homoserine kinase [Rhodospirillum rubrum]MBK1665831.1 homoserine kinase [Rhodospirillum rubrum]MBK1676818.1 homoserine kinase [Rhodospirillum rubrum]
MAVYTDVSDDDLTTFLEGYDIGRLRACKGIAEGVENSNFLLVTDRGPHILTLYEKRVNPDDLPFFLGLLRHLAARDIPCPQPVAGRDGAVLHTLCDRPAAIVTFLDGVWPKRPEVRHCAQLGEALARLHLAGGDYPPTRRNSLSVDGWRPLFDAAAERADSIKPGLRVELEAELDALEALWPRNLPTGIIHADLFPDNVFFVDDTLSGLIDFYFACDDFLAYDLAVCLNAWCFEGEREFNVTKARHMLTRYEKVRPLSDAEFAALPLLARGAAMRFLLTRLYDWLNTPPGAMVRPKDPMEYYHKLAFHRAVSGPGAYGLSR